MTKVYSMKAVAKELGLEYQTLWTRVYMRDQMPKPSVRIGRRQFYSEAQLAELKNAPIIIN